MREMALMDWLAIGSLGFQAVAIVQIVRTCLYLRKVEKELEERQARYERILKERDGTD